jgi:hypothetical protein
MEDQFHWDSADSFVSGIARMIRAKSRRRSFSKPISSNERRKIRQCG